MYGRSAVGCAYHSNGCGNSNSPSNSGFETSATYVQLNPPFTEQMVFFGVNRIMALWDGTSNTNVIFDSGNITKKNSDLTVGVYWTGNLEDMFTLAYSYITIQTYSCPDIAPDRYYRYNSYVCDSNCNSTIQQFPNATRYCQPCGTLCYQCVNLADSCTACYNSQNRVLNASNCSCDLAGGFYDDGSSVVCPSCHYSCKTCTGPSSGACLTCEASFYRAQLANTCPCTLGHYDAGAATCGNCHYSCGTATCNGSQSNRCLSCNSTANRQISGSFTCLCMTGFYDNGSSESCAVCHLSCLTCTTTNVKCLSCNSTLRRSYVSASNTCPCDAGYFDNGTAMCQPCYLTCYTCNGPLKTNCLSCTGASSRTLNGSYCQCPSKYFDLSDVCTPCHYSCLNCRNASQLGCYQCDATQYRTLDVATNSCLCNPGFYEGGTAVCLTCSTSCFTCVSTASTCTSCHNTTARFQAGNTCFCSPGYVDVFLNGSCSLCHYSCVTCSSVLATGCSSCPTGRTLTSGSCLCPSGSFDNGAAVACQPCASTCLNCSNQLASSCTACYPLHLRFLSPSPTGSCVCGSAYFDSGALICSPCDAKCLTCMVAATNCSSCDSLLFRTLSSNHSCDCKPAYFDSGSLPACQPCSSLCLTCVVSPANCTACVSSRYLSSNSCLCNVGTYQDGAGVCQVCGYTCVTCFGTSTNCTSCSVSANRQTVGNTCPCLSSYYDAGVVNCIACGYSCLTCSSGTVCLSCPAGSQRTLQPNGSCLCGGGYYDDGSNPTCPSCHFKCKTCQYYSQCLSCDGALFRSWDSVNLACPCQPSYYDSGSAQCQPCHFSCALCTGGSSNECTSCPATRIITAPSSCPCRTGFF
jgi:proprotein convertase subtilisin/kexin type 5